MLRKVMLVVVLVLILVLAVVVPASAASTGNKGQPSQSCQSFFPTGPLTPSGFNSGGFVNHATQVYAGTQPQNSKNPAAVSQYDVACFQQASK